MESNHKVEKDYRKWVMFNDTLKEHQKLYELYTALRSQSSQGSVDFEQSRENGSVTYIIKQKDVDLELRLQGDPELSRLIDYMDQHFFANQDVEEWYMSKVNEKDRQENDPSANLRNNQGYVKQSFHYTVYPKEKFYYRIRAFFSGLFYLGILLFIAMAFVQSSISGAFSILIVLGVFLFFFLLRRFVHGIFMGIVKGNSVPVNASQYPALFEIIEEQSRQIGLKDIPEVYVASGHFNAFTTNLARRKYLVLFSEVIETCLKGDYDVVRFVVGHELGHIHRNHVNKDSWLMPSNLIPFLRLAYSRACEYTCDRIGYHFSNKGAMEGILILATGKEIFTKFKADQYIEDSTEEFSFWVWFSEKFLSHPHIYKRLRAIRDYNRQGN